MLISAKHNQGFGFQRRGCWRIRKFLFWFVLGPGSLGRPRRTREGRRIALEGLPGPPGPPRSRVKQSKNTILFARPDSGLHSTGNRRRHPSGFHSCCAAGSPHPTARKRHLHPAADGLGFRGMGFGDLIENRSCWGSGLPLGGFRTIQEGGGLRPPPF